MKATENIEDQKLPPPLNTNPTIQDQSAEKSKSPVITETPEKISNQPPYSASKDSEEKKHIEPFDLSPLKDPVTEKVREFGAKCITHQEDKLHFCTEEKTFCCQFCLESHIGHLIIFYPVLINLLTSKKNLNVLTKSSVGLQNLKTAVIDFMEKLESSILDLFEKIDQLQKLTNNSISKFQCSDIPEDFWNKMIDLLSAMKKPEPIRKETETLEKISFEQLLQMKNKLVPDTLEIHEKAKKVVSDQIIEKAKSFDEQIQYVESDTKTVWKLSPKNLTTQSFQISNNVIIPQFIEAINCRDRVFLMGGKHLSKFSKEVFELDEKNSTLIPRSPMLVAKAGFAVCKLEAQSSIFTVGGWNGNALKDAEKYSIDLNKWETLPPLNEGRKDPKLLTFKNEYLYVIGGFNGNPLSTIERGNLLTNTFWEKIIISLQNGWTGRQNLQACPIGENTILIFGGHDTAKYKDEVFSLQISKDLKGHSLKKSQNMLVPDSFSSAVEPIVDETGIFAISATLNIHSFFFSTNSWKVVYRGNWIK